ncbi:MAG: CopG family transcriptional regulator [Candidatus Aenigmarchaeota archaeon]|nr:ribbon-helix-helix domain-containing protein [Candidatus Aenigmarchaeota archaeon]MDW8149551.1 CopG family transcriptional regulator [Candidatus Aenigmarchaeota archaeon]
MRQKAKNVQVRLPIELVENLKKEAEQTGLSLSSYVRVMIIQHLKEMVMRNGEMNV